MTQEYSKNSEFYKNCTEYFEFLRKKGISDYEFEDEYYFTMPAISNQYNTEDLGIPLNFINYGFTPARFGR